MNSPVLTKEHNVHVWDLPTRVFHWVLAFAVLGLAVTGLVGGNAMQWHFRLGYLVGSLLVFRFLWGLVGGHYSRFASFMYAPRHVLDYLRGDAKPEHLVGHNPLGALSVFAMLLFLLLQVTTGLLSDDEISSAGPLTRFVSDAVVSKATWYHQAVGKWVLLVLVLLHLGAIAYYLKVKGQNLVHPMLTGDKFLPSPDMPQSVDNGKKRLQGLLIFALSCLLFYVISLQRV